MADPSTPSGPSSAAQTPERATAPSPWSLEALGALVDHGHIRREGARAGPLHGTTFAVKDLFDIAGVPTGAGNPTWLARQPVPTITAPALQALLGAGATLIGKTHTDELAFSLNGENYHYGTPINPAAPDRIPGGSSSGSVSVTAAGLCDFALGTDTGGSIRVPASYCGVFGLRPSHGAVSLDGVVPLAPLFDTVGWFARRLDTLRAVADVLLPPVRSGAPEHLLLARDAWALAWPEVQQALQAALQPLYVGPPGVPVPRGVDLAPKDSLPAEAQDDHGGLEAWFDAFRILQGHAIWQTHGPWIEAEEPAFGPGIADRFRWARTISDADAAARQPIADAAAQRVASLLRPPGTILILPAAPGPAPLRGQPPEQLEDFRYRALRLTAPGGLAGAPQITLPLVEVAGGPVGLSLMAAPGRDQELLAAAAWLLARLGRDAQ